MPNQESLATVETAELIQSVDTGRAADDPFKLPTGLRSLLDARLTDLKAKDTATLLREGDRAGASARVQEVLNTLRALLRDGYNFVRAIPSYEISEADLLSVFTAYGWDSGEIGELTDDRVEGLANQAVAATASITTATWRYPSALMTRITDYAG